MFQKLKPYKLVILLLIFSLFIVLGKNAYAASNSCGNGITNIPQHMEVSCNTTPLQFSVPVSVVAGSGGYAVSGSATLNVGFPQNIPLFQFLDSVSSVGTVDQSNSYFDNLYQPYGYFVEKTNINPNVNFNIPSSSNGVGAIDVPSGCSSVSGVKCSVLSTSGASQYAYFAVPGIGKAVDLFTLGNMFTISSSPYAQSLNNLSTPFISSTPQNPVGSCVGSANGCVNNKMPLAYKLTTTYGNNPYNPANNAPLTTLATAGVTVFNWFGQLLTCNFLIKSGCQFTSSGIPPYCSKYIAQVNQSSPISTSNFPYCPVTGFSINVSFSCQQYVGPVKTLESELNATNPNDTQQIKILESELASAEAALNACMNTLQGFLQNGIPVSFNTNLYLQGLNRILADEWYAEAALDGGPAIGHTNMKAWTEYVNPATDELYSSYQKILDQGPSNPQYASLTNALFLGIGENVQVSISVTSSSGSTGISTTTFPTSSFYFPWIGDALQIQQNLAIHNFQPYFQNSPTSNLPKLAQGEYYIQNQSQYPDPLLLYLLYVGALSPKDPVVQNALGSYPINTILQSSSGSGTGGGYGGGGITNTSGKYNQQACDAALTMARPSTISLSLSQLLQYANDFIGANYSQNRDFSRCYPNAAPGVYPGIDCSSFVATLYKDMGIPLAQDSTTETQYSYSQSALNIFTNLNNVAAGDLIYFYEQADYPQAPPQHVALITRWNGPNNFDTIQATYPGNGVVNDNYTKGAPLCLTLPGGAVSPGGNSSCIMGFASPKAGQFN
ncbi:MAG: NlpC/P60 family protein [Patescibacteria group bacterium]